MNQVEAIRSQVEQRKVLEQELKELKKKHPILQKQKKNEQSLNLSTNVRIGEQLRVFADPAKKLRKRECYQQLQYFIYGEEQNRVFILYGLRRTGKTTLIRQILAEMSDENLGKAVFIQVRAKDTLANVNQDLKLLEAQGFRYVFLDEVTLLEDFIERVALFSDVFAASGMKIVLSGTNSLGFLFAEDEQLYDRCILLHTTWIPYREFEAVLGISGIKESIWLDMDNNTLQKTTGGLHHGTSSKIFKRSRDILFGNSGRRPAKS